MVSGFCVCVCVSLYVCLCVCVCVFHCVTVCVCVLRIHPSGQTCRLTREADDPCIVCVHLSDHIALCQEECTPSLPPHIGQKNNVVLPPLRVCVCVCVCVCVFVC